MTQRHDASRPEHDPAGRAAALSGAVESTSTRVLVDGNSRRCGACGAAITAGSRYRCVTVRDGDGVVSEVCFCGDECVDSVRALDAPAGLR